MILLGTGVQPGTAQILLEGLHYLDGSPVRVEIRDGLISRVERTGKLTGGSKSLYIAPGLFDNQVNGFAGVSFSFAGGELTREGILKATRALWEKGVTSYLPTLTTNSHELLVHNLEVLARSKDDEALLGSIPGFHLEGPYINPEDGYRGAHPRRHVRKPHWDEFTVYREASGDNILTITVAPEMDGALEFIRKCTAEGIVVALGHHNAPARVIDQAVANGAKISTHLGNGCANMINRHVNPLWPQLASEGLSISIICDGFHLLPEEIRVFYGIKGPEKTVIISDVTSYAALPPGEYRTPGGETIELTPEGMLRYPAQNVLYGSASPVSRGVAHIIKVTGCSLGDAIGMASTNTANLYHLTDRGILEPGKRADLILFTIGENDLEIRKTYVQGNLVYESHVP
ncbi:MAG: N-acetylglucosamine-6-phosphate deacetylase [Bacteroidota bacterium]